MTTTNSGAKQPLIHFHSGDPRFCDSDESIRRFTVDPNQVTCEECKGRDGFQLSESGLGLLRELGYVDEQGRIC